MHVYIYIYIHTHMACMYVFSHINCDHMYVCGYADMKQINKIKPMHVCIDKFIHTYEYTDMSVPWHKPILYGQRKCVCRTIYIHTHIHKCIHL